MQPSLAQFMWWCFHSLREVRNWSLASAKTDRDTCSLAHVPVYMHAWLSAYVLVRSLTFMRPLVLHFAQDIM